MIVEIGVYPYFFERREDDGPSGVFPLYHTLSHFVKRKIKKNFFIFFPKKA